MMVRKLGILFFLVTAALYTSCEKSIISTQEKYIGEWRYVGTFDHRANYACYICPEFDFDKTIYRISLKPDKSLTTEINLMRGVGLYEVTLRDPKSNNSIYDISINEYRELNKPYETEADGKFRTAFLNSYWLSIVDQKEGYDQLQLQFNENEFLLFVKKN
jgi:hypothetical protein